MTGNFFNSPTFGKIKFDTAVNQIIDFILSDSRYNYDLVVGSDSQNNKDKTYFVTAIIVHRKGAGGRFYWQKTSKKKIDVLRNRIYDEAILSIETAEKVLKIIKKNKSLVYNLEIHVDIGCKGKTKEFIQEITGMIKGVGFKVKTKPDSYAASTVADRYT
jgi:uncharacterized protein